MKSGSHQNRAAMSTTTTITTTVVTTKETKNLKNSVNEPRTLPLTIIRITLLCLAYVAYLNADIIQGYIDITWEWLRHQWWYRTVYFETFLVQAYSFPAIFPYRFMHTAGLGEKYRIEGVGGVYNFPTYTDIVMEAVEYTWPLFILDTFHVKSYAGVSEQVLTEKRKNWVQVTRGLPEAPPKFGDLVVHLIIGLILYDICFFLCHYLFHKNAKLYKYFHSKHHDHGSLNAKVANRLHVFERFLLVLSANFGLKIQGAHPLTRTVFVFVFLSMLIDNHSGYDFPYSYDKIFPRGLIAGPRRHYEHHVNGTRYYQPYFTYIDDTLEWLRKKKLA